MNIRLPHPWSVLLPAAVSLGIATFAGGATPARPNILIIQSDQHRGTIMGCMGDAQAITPNLDRLAAEGILFRRAVSSAPACCPFRGSMQTGLYPQKHGVLGNDRYRLDARCPTIAEMLVAAGYKTGYIGKWHLDSGLPEKEGGPGLSGRTASAAGGFVPPERRRGYQEWNGYEKGHEFFEVWRYNEQGKKERVKGYDWEPTWHTDMALDFARRHTEAGEPWYYYISFGPPHVPEQCPQKYLDMFPLDKIVLPPDVAALFPGAKEKDIRKKFQMYYALVAAVDVEIGRLLEGLKRIGADENTIILYTSDHGDYLGSHVGEEGLPSSRPEGVRGKGNPYANSFRIPCIVRWPARIKPGQVCDALLTGADFAPTLLDLAGAPALPGAQGTSMAPWCLTGRGPAREAVWLGLQNWRAVWDGRYVYSPAPYKILYDHQADPYEMRNRFGDAGSAEIRRRLHALLVDLAHQLDDPMAEKLQAMK